MGSRLFSNTTNLLGGHDFRQPRRPREGRRRARASTRAASRAESSWAYHEIIEGILAGKIRGLWVIATNPAHSWINQGQCSTTSSAGSISSSCRTCTTRTETAQLADLVLPAAGWGEKEGTFINSERRIGLIKKVPARRARPWPIFTSSSSIAHYWGCGEMFRDWDSPEAVFQILKEIDARTAVRHHRHRRLRHARAFAAGSNGRLPAAADDVPSPSVGCSRTADSFMPTAAPGSSSKILAQCPKDRPPSFPSCCSRAAARPRSGTRKLELPSRRPAQALPAECLRRDQSVRCHSAERPAGRSGRGDLPARPIRVPAPSSPPQFSRDNCSFRCTTK